jgi:hypothetical protein
VFVDFGNLTEYRITFTLYCRQKVTLNCLRVITISGRVGEGDMKRMLLLLIAALVASASLSGCFWEWGHDRRDGDRDRDHDRGQTYDRDHDHDRDYDRDRH